MSKKLLWMTTTFLIVFILSGGYSQAMYLPSTEEDLNQERLEEAKNYAISHPELYIEMERDLEIVTQYRDLEEVYRRVNNWWQIAKSEWGTGGISTAIYFWMLDENTWDEIRWGSAVILTPFLMAVAGTKKSQIWTERFEGREKEKYLFEGEEVMMDEMALRDAESAYFYAWFFHIPFIIESAYSFPPETKYFLRYSPEDYVIDVDEKIEMEAVYATSRESVVGEESAGFFYYVAFPAEKILFSPATSSSFNEETSEFTGKMVLTVVTNVGEELIFPFDLSEMR